MFLVLGVSQASDIGAALMHEYRGKEACPLKASGTSAEKKKIVFLVGPTAIGKTRVAVHLAKLINAEIVSCDSMQVYKGMDIGTQKPTLTKRRIVPHHMIDIISPAKNFSAAEFRKMALGYIKKLHKKSKIPLFVGGTALYMKVLIDGLFNGPSTDRTLRQDLLKQEEQNGKGFLYKRLAEVDAETARNLHPNDLRRIIRALEVYYKSGAPISRLKEQTKGLADRYDIKIFALTRDRQKLYERIEKRVDRMFKQGLVKECRRLTDTSPQTPALKGRGSKRKRLSVTASQALGYKEVFAYLDSKLTLEEAKESVKKNTRHFAKRQLSWLRNDKRVVWVDAEGKPPRRLAQEISLQCMK